MLADKDVEILDPATGTGTFITELVEYLPKHKLAYKYKHEIHCNEVAILPYYIANLNIEFTYKQKMGEYQEFDNICFVDTLEHTSFYEKQLDIFALSIENVDLHLTGNSQCLPLYRYDKEGNRIDNITDWGLEQFQTHYQDSTITKLDIFHYTYAVLHNPEYRKKYELNLKREFPRLPFCEDFQKWVNWGKQLMDLHINYETVEPYPLKQIDIPCGDVIRTPKPKLKADKTKGSITLDENSSLEGVPKIAWEYLLGNRSALEWILDQYKEKKPKDPTIAEKFNNYRFADYKEQVIDLLQRVCMVSVETMKIIQQMEKID